jgi:hypothetical protein
MSYDDSSFHVSTVFITEVVIMSTVDLIFPVAFYMPNDN